MASQPHIISSQNRDMLRGGCVPAKGGRSSPDMSSEAGLKGWLEHRWIGSIEDGSPLLQEVLWRLSEGVPLKKFETLLAIQEHTTYRRAARISSLRLPADHQRKILYKEYNRTVELTGMSQFENTESLLPSYPKPSPLPPGKPKKTTPRIGKPVKEESGPRQKFSTPRGFSNSNRMKTSPRSRAKSTPRNHIRTQTRVTRSKAKNTTFMRLDDKSRAVSI